MFLNTSDIVRCETMRGGSENVSREFPFLRTPSFADYTVQLAAMEWR